MFSFFNDLRQFCNRYDLSIHDLAWVVQQVRVIGLPPDVSEKDKFRAWLARMIPLLSKISEGTIFGWDDVAITFWERVLKSDDSWELFYDLFLLVYGVDVPDHVQAEGKTETLKQSVGMDIDWDEIRKLIDAIIEIIEMLS